MGIKTIVVSDFTEEALPEGTGPLAIVLGSRAVDVYLSDSERETLEELLAPYFEVGTPARAGRGAGAATTTGRSRGQRTCGVCGEVGHDKRTCPNA